MDIFADENLMAGILRTSRVLRAFGAGFRGFAIGIVAHGIFLLKFISDAAGGRRFFLLEHVDGAKRIRYNDAKEWCG